MGRLANQILIKESAGKASGSVYITFVVPSVVVVVLVVVEKRSR